MEIVLSTLENLFLGRSSFEIILALYAVGGWVIFVNMLTFVFSEMWKAYKSGQYTKNWKWVLLAIDIPQENVQTPKAVEQLFSHIFSVMEPPGINTLYGRGFQQFQFSFEIISIEGYIQFLIRTLDVYQDVVEAAVYAQYPGADIIEVEDYVTDIPDKYPNDTHNIWAADFVLTQHFAYPIRLYSEFEHNISKDTVLKDPMGTFLESFSRIGVGEQLWWQIIIEPIAEKGWKNDCIDKIKELIGEKKPTKKSPLSFLSDNPISKELGKSFQELNAQLTGSPRSEDDASYSSSDGPPNNLLYLTPGQKDLVERMEQKISKIGFTTKMRGVYVARNEVYKPSRAVNSLVGAINQFNNPSSNSILPSYITSTRYMFAEQRKNQRRNVLIKAFKNRNPDAGKGRYVLNIEELATIWHFPMSHVKTPLLQKSLIQTSEPPIGLPIERLAGMEELPRLKEVPPEERSRNLTDTGEEIEWNDFG